MKQLIYGLSPNNKKSTNQAILDRLNKAEITAKIIEKDSLEYLEIGLPDDATDSEILLLGSVVGTMETAGRLSSPVTHSL